MAVKSSPTRPAARQPRPSQAPRTTPPRPPRNNDRFAHDILGLVFIALGLILGVSLIGQHGGHAGLLGSWLVEGLRLAVGIGAWVFPILLTAIGIMLIQGRHQSTRTNFAGGAALLFLAGISWWHLGHTTRATEFSNITEGGWVGAAISSGLRALVGDVSSHICLFLFTVGAVVWATDMRLLHLFHHAVAGSRRVTGPVTQGVQASALAAKQSAAALKQRAEARRVIEAPKQRTATEQPVGAPLAAPSSSAPSSAAPSSAAPSSAAPSALLLPACRRFLLRLQRRLRQNQAQRLSTPRHFKPRRRTTCRLSRAFPCLLFPPPRLWPLRLPCLRQFRLSHPKSQNFQPGR